MSTIISVTKVKLKRPVQVYDIEVPGNSNFVLGNGSVVHNSKDISDAVAGSHMDAMKHKDEFLFFHPSDYDYEGINSSKADTEKYKEELTRSITNTVPKQDSVTNIKPSVADIFDSIYISDDGILTL